MFASVTLPQFVACSVTGSFLVKVVVDTTTAVCTKGKERATTEMPGHSDEVLTLALSDDERYLASWQGSQSGRVGQCWERSEQTEIR